MKVSAFFKNEGTPATGLSPVLDGWLTDGTQVLTSVSMTEIGGGFYFYDYTSYEDSEDYVFRADGGVSLPSTERYVATANEMGEVTDQAKKVRKVETNKLIIQNNTLTIYDDDGVTALYTFDLKDVQGNPDQINVFRRIPQ